MVHVRREADHWDMTKWLDEKLDLLAKAFSWLSVREIELLGRLTELVLVPAGTALDPDEAGTSWSYLVLDGSVFVSCGEEISLAGRGSWISAHHRDVTSVTAASDLVAIAVGIRQIPTVRSLLVRAPQG